MEKTCNSHPSFVSVKFTKLEPDVQKLLRDAVAVRELAYAPYSKFKVGACLSCEDGSTFKGCNVENAVPAGICAERTAYVKAISEGHLKFKAIAITAYQQEYITTPCGICRQFMIEFGNITVYLAKPSLEEVYVTSLHELLPYHFQTNYQYT